jgi:hypothetical protein
VESEASEALWLAHWASERPWTRSVRKDSNPCRNGALERHCRPSNVPKRRYDRGTFPADRDRTTSSTLSLLDR